MIKYYKFKIVVGILLILKEVGQFFVFYIKFSYAMKSVMLPLLFCILLSVGGCAEKESKLEVSEKISEQLVQVSDMERYKLFPTQNLWTFIKLDTQTGQMWQLQYSVNDKSERLEYDLNPYPLITDKQEKVNGRFELYPTQNIYNFILLDQIDGKTWQVQWAIEEENRVVLPIR